MTQTSQYSVHGAAVTFEQRQQKQQQKQQQVTGRSNSDSGSTAEMTSVIIAGQQRYPTAISLRSLNTAVNLRMTACI